MPAHHKQLYRFIRDYIHHRGFPPSLEEMGAYCSISSRMVIQLLSKLEGQGRIILQANRPGSIRLPDLEHRWQMEGLIDTFIHHYQIRYEQMPSLDSISSECGLAASFVLQYLNQTGRTLGQH
jgi:SOS-response transcriptional repressor LexA